MNPDSQYRSLTDDEITRLTGNGCVSDDWKQVRAKNGFDTSRCRNTAFSGSVLLGIFEKDSVDKSGVSLISGIYNSHLHNCIVGDNCSIHNIGDYIANYVLENNVVIKDCGRIHTEGTSSFGNGTTVEVINEAGSRAVKIWDRLSSHQAYISALYRHRTGAITKIDRLTDDYVSGITSTTGLIGSGSVIKSCGIIRNVRFGQGSLIEGVLRLNDGTINSCIEDPVHIGTGVIMDHFIVCSGSIVSDSVIIDRCFIGQGCVMGKHFSAENSLFFANCSAFNGEVCSVFAGPYTVTHHKSTLLIAGLFSFMNAGSGTNQSNHMYKIGPVHQGIIERGSKTGSNSYLMWPSRIGPFTIIIGSHYKNLDTSCFPFSYLIEQKNESILVPAINLRNAGTIRDTQKWPERDRRKNPAKTDLINFSLLNPYIVGRMISGRNLLEKLMNENSSKDSCIINGIKIRSDSLKRSRMIYQAGIDKYLGDAFVKMLEPSEFRGTGQLKELLKPKSEKGKGEWTDLSGLIVPKSEILSLLGNIENEETRTLDAVQQAFENMNKSYYDWEWSWVIEKLEEETGKDLDDFCVDDIISIIERWDKSVSEIDNLLYDDIKKEFALSSMIGYGIDEDEALKILDFEQVRGTIESNAMALSIKDHLLSKNKIAEKIIIRLKATK